MAVAVRTRMRWRVCTCECVIDYDLSREATFTQADYTASMATPVNIAAKCTAHAAAVTAADLDALVAPENEALSRVGGIIFQELGRDKAPEYVSVDDANFGLQAWSIDPVTRDVVVDVNYPDVSSVPNVVVSTTMVAGGREVATWIGPDVSHSVGTGQRIIQGNVKSNQQSTADVSGGVGGATSNEWYFNAIGNNVLYYTRIDSFYSSDPNPAYETLRNVVNFPGILDFFTVKIGGNDRNEDTSLRIRVNNTDTEQWVRVPAYRSGVFTCIGDPVSYVAGDDIVGFMTSDWEGVDIYGQYDRMNFRATHCEMQPTSGYHTQFHTSGVESLYATGSYTAFPRTRFLPLAGSNQHYYWGDRLRGNDFAQAGESAKRFEFKVRAPGTFKNMAVAGYHSSGVTTPYELIKNGNTQGGTGENFPSATIFPAVPFTNDIELVLGDEGEYCVAETGDLLSIRVTGDLFTPSNASFWYQTGVHWEGAVGNNLIDHQVTEDYKDSDNENYSTDWGLWGTKFRYINQGYDGDRIDEWFASPIGEFHPRSAYQVRHSILGWDDIVIRPSFTLEILYMRAFCDATDTQNPLDIGVGIFTDGGFGAGYGDLQATIGTADERWYEDAANRDEITSRQGFCLRFKAYENDNECKIHITNIMFSYRSASASAERLCLTRILPEATAVTADPCVTHRSRCIKITRTDDEVFAYTEHDEDIVYAGTTYQTRGGLSGSASELGSVLGEVGNIELGGFTRELGITVDDLFGGKFDGATVQVYLIPWGDYQATETVVTLGGGVIGKTTQDGNTFTLEALSPSAQIRQKALLQLFTPTCRFALGDSRCQVDLTSLTVSGAVTALTDEMVQTGATVRRRFYDTSRTEDDGWFDEGLITFVTGENAGQTSKVKSYATGELVLWEPLIHVIAIGDTYTMTPGCDKKADTCRDKFDNFINFGGFPTIPGLDATAKTPSGRMGG